MWRSFATIRKYLWRYRGGLAVGGLCLVLKDVAQVGQPLMIGRAVDALRAGGPLFLRYVGWLIGLALVKGVFQYWMRVIIIGISRDIEYDLRNDLFAHLVRLSPDYYGRTRTGDIMARATNDLNAVRMMLGPGVMYWFETSLTFALAIAVMLRFDWRLALYAVLPAPAVSAAVILFGRAIHERFEKIQAMFSDISSRVQENLSGVRMIRAFVQERAEMRRFEELNRRYIAQNLRLVRIQGLFQPLLEVLIGCTFLVVLWTGGRDVLRGRISIGSFVMFNTYMGTLVWPMIALGWVVNLMQRGGASLSRINQILNEKPTIAAPSDPVPLGTVRGEIEFRGVSLTAAARPWRASICAFPRAPPSRWWGTPVPARAPWPAWFRGSWTPPAARSWWTASMCAEWIPRNCGGTSASCRRRPSCSAPASPRTSLSAWNRPPRIRSAARPKSPACREISRASRTATRPWWASAASRSPEARSSARPSPAPFCAIPGF
jgi:ATP-binding cassette subfamily B protein